MKKIFLTFLLFFQYITVLAINNPDLLDWLEININDNLSWISELRVELWSCLTIYSFSTALNTVIKSSVSPNWVKDSYKWDLVIKYDQSTTYASTTVPSLLSKYWKSRLDECLAEWKNYLIIRAKDQARSNSNATSLTVNQTILNYSTNNKFIKVDNSPAKLKISGELSNVTSSSDPSNCYIWWANIDWNWRNYSLDWNIQSWDPFASWDWCGQSCTANPTLNQCLTDINWFSKPTDWIWSAPWWVLSNWQYSSYLCWWINFPDTSSCNWSCPAWKIKNQSWLCIFDPVSNNNCCVIWSTDFINGTCNICNWVPTDVSFSWQSWTYSSCTATCWGWTKYRTVSCQWSDGGNYPDSYCTEPKPSESLSCNTQACAPIACSVTETFTLLWENITWCRKGRTTWNYSPMTYTFNNLSIGTHNFKATGDVLVRKQNSWSGCGNFNCPFTVTCNSSWIATVSKTDLNCSKWIETGIELQSYPTWTQNSWNSRNWWLLPTMRTN